MIKNVMATKTNFLLAHRHTINNIITFESSLNTFFSTNAKLRTTDTYWNSYIHAAFLSSYLEIVGYDLINWNNYVQNSSSIKAAIGLSSNFTESDILEYFVMHSINKVFKYPSNGIVITALRSNDNRSPSYLTDDSNTPTILNPAENKLLIENLKIVMKLRGLPRKEIWGDNDIIVVLRHKGVLQQFCIISCKTSLRERVYQSIFWATHSRLEGIGKHVFITIDKGASGTSEIGNRAANNNAKKTRDVLESTMDRVYVLRNSNEVNRSQVIKDFSYLENDLIRWSEDIVGI